MRSIQSIAGYLPGAALLALTLVGPCLAQEAESRQQQIAEHQRKLQQDMREKRADAAISELRALVALEPDDADTRANLGVLLFFKGDYTSALPELRKATQLRQGLWRIRALTAECELRTGDPVAARADFEDVFPHLEDTRLRMQTGMELIDLYVAAGETGKAVPVVEVLRTIEPANPRVLYLAYRIYSDLAGGAMLGLAVAAPDSAETHQVMARESLRYGDPPGAIEQYRAAIKIDPKLPDVHLELADVLASSASPADKAEALAEYNRALAQNPADERAVCRLAESEAETGSLDKARQDYTRAISLAPGDVDARLGLAKLLMMNGHGDEASAQLEQAETLEPENPAVHYLLGKLDWQQGRKDEALKEQELYKKYKSIRDRLQDVYKIMRVAPTQIRAGKQGDSEEIQGK